MFGPTSLECANSAVSALLLCPCFRQVTSILSQGDAFKRMVTLLCTRIAGLESEVTIAFGGTPVDIGKPGAAGKPDVKAVTGSAASSSGGVGGKKEALTGTGTGFLARITAIEATLQRHEGLAARLALVEEKLDRLHNSHSCTSMLVTDLTKDTKDIRSALDGQRKELSGLSTSVDSVSERVTEVHTALATLQLNSGPSQESLVEAGTQMDDGDHPRPSSGRSRGRFSGFKVDVEASGGDNTAAPLSGHASARTPGSHHGGMMSRQSSRPASGIHGGGHGPIDEEELHSDLPLFSDVEIAEIQGLITAAVPPPPAWLLSREDWDALLAQRGQDSDAVNKLKDEVAAVIALQGTWQAGEHDRTNALLTKLQVCIDSKQGAWCTLL